jgi:type VI secretion system FHA domain protein
VQGLLETLSARSTLKTEFRIERTAIQPRNNNPLKFSATALEALAAILSPPMPAFAKGAEAIEEAFNDLREHQIGTIGGMERALQHLLDSVSPEAVERTAGAGGGLGAMLPGGRKARLWDAYVELHRRLSDGASENVRDLFGRSFAEGYERRKDRR